MKNLYELSFEELKDLVENYLYLKGWGIRKDKLKNRKESVQYTSRYDKIKRQADENGIKYNDTEVVTWFDSLKLLYNAFGYINDGKLLENIKIIQEYCIPYSNKRADYILLYDNKILILEFSFNKLDDVFNYETKLRQAIGYKELLSNILPREMDIGTYTFLVEADEDEIGNPLYKDGTQDSTNHDKIHDLAKYIDKFFNKNVNLAYKSIINVGEI